MSKFSFRSVDDKEGIISDKVDMLVGFGFPHDVSLIYAEASYEANKIMRAAREKASQTGAENSVINNIEFIRGFGLV